PDSVADLVHSAHTALVESVVETDDALMEAYFEGVEPDREVLVKTVHEGMRKGEIFPVLVTAAHRLVGIDTSAESLVDFGPSTSEHSVPPLSSGSLEISPDGPPVAYVFKTMADPFVGRISMFRVFSGTIPVDAELELAGDGKVGMHNLFKMQGKEHRDVQSVGVGEIAAVAKVDNARAGDTLRAPGSDVVIVPMEQPVPVMEIAVAPKSQADEEKLSTALARAAEADPTLRIERRAETG